MKVAPRLREEKLTEVGEEASAFERVSISTSPVALFV
jgi:hypothetical protein